MMKKQIFHSIGIDIGTSHIAVSLCTNQQEIQCMYQEENESHVSSHMKGAGFESLQDTTRIVHTVKTLLDRLCEEHVHYKIEGIGISNQMHGIVYIDEQGYALSSLYNWQDMRGNERYNASMTVAEHVSHVCKRPVSTGYGIVTHTYNQIHGLVPNSTHYIVDIGSFVAIQLVKTLDMLAIHPSNAHAWGIYDMDTQDCDYHSLDALGVDRAMIPSIGETRKALGKYREIPVFQSIGDGQAGVLGAIGNHEDSVLMNIGTSAQLSCVVDKDLAGAGKTHLTNLHSHPKELEYRPFIDGAYLCVISSLNGGNIIDLWVDFLANTICTFDSQVSQKELKQEVYAYIVGLTETNTSVGVSPRFSGTRSNPQDTASIHHLTSSNFNIKEISVAMTKAVVEELYLVWNRIPSEIRDKKRTLILTGGGTRISLFTHVIEHMFPKLAIKEHTTREYAVMGAAKWVFFLTF